MSTIGQIERLTQNRIVNLFCEQLGYQYLGNWEDRFNNSNIEETLLRKYLFIKAGYPGDLVERAIYKLQKEAQSYDRNLYNNNKEVYKLLRYGAEVTADPGINTSACISLTGLNRSGTILQLPKRLPCRATGKRDRILCSTLTA